MKPASPSKLDEILLNLTAHSGVMPRRLEVAQAAILSEFKRVLDEVIGRPRNHGDFCDLVLHRLSLVSGDVHCTCSAVDINEINAQQRQTASRMLEEMGL